jgi:plastocyanin
MGVPTEAGQLRWPLPLRVMASPATPERELREQIDALFEVIATHAAYGETSPALLEELGEAVKQFRALVFRDRPERIVFSRKEWDEAERFLDKLEHARQVLSSTTDPVGKEGLQTTKASLIEVGVADNSFEAETVLVPVGATIQWTNTGKHTHTITADDGSWSSKELRPNGTYRQTFARPGTYAYHCANHPEEIRGTIVVK